MSSHQPLFDKTLYRQRKQRHLADASQHLFLHELVEGRISELLDSIQRTFAQVVIYGAASNRLAQHPRIGQALFMDRVATPHVQVLCDEEWMPLAYCSVDAIISVLNLHHCNDVVGTLQQWQRALTPDGLLIVVVLGVRSGAALRASLEWAEMQQGGISPRLSPLMDIRDAGGLLQRVGLQLPVIESDMLALSYHDMFALMRELRGAGESNILLSRTRRPTARHVFAAANAYYHTHYGDAEGRIPAIIELLTLTGWKAHHSQQQPLTRGSGTQSLRQVF